MSTNDNSNGNAPSTPIDPEVARLAVAELTTARQELRALREQREAERLSAEVTAAAREFGVREDALADLRDLLVPKLAGKPNANPALLVREHLNARPYLRAGGGGGLARSTSTTTAAPSALPKLGPGSTNEDLTTWARLNTHGRGR